MSLNPNQAKQAQAQEVIFSWKTNKIIHPSLYFNNATVKVTHTQKHLGLQLYSKLSFNDHANNEISKATNGVGFHRKLEHFYDAEVYWSFTNLL